MITISASPMQAIRLGRVGENERQRVAFDVAALLAELPGASFTVINQGPGDAAAYPCPGVTLEGGTLYWPITSAELQQTGRGRCELIVTVGDVVAKSVIYSTQILEALDGSGETPSEWETWQTEFAGMVADAEDSATTAHADAQTASDASGAAIAAKDAAVTAKNDAVIAKTAAETAASNASGYSSTATAKATEAAQSASNAAASATSAQTAQSAAESAQALAEAAQTAAETAQSGAESAMGTAGEYRDEVVAAADGIAQQTTAESISAQMTAITALLQQIVEEGLSGGGLNGFSLSLDADNHVVLSYTNPEDDTDTADAIMPSDTTGAAIIAELQSINASLHEMIPTGEQEG